MAGAIGGEIRLTNLFSASEHILNHLLVHIYTKLLPYERLELKLNALPQQVR